MKDYYLIVRHDGSLVRRGSGQGPCIYYSESKAKQHGPRQASWELRTDPHPPRILHIQLLNGQTVMYTGWIDL